MRSASSWEWCQLEGAGKTRFSMPWPFWPGWSKKEHSLISDHKTCGYAHVPHFCSVAAPLPDDWAKKTHFICALSICWSLDLPRRKFRALVVYGLSARKQVLCLVVLVAAVYLWLGAQWDLFGRGLCVRLSPLALFFGKKPGKQGGVVHFQGSPNCGGAAVQRCWVQQEAPLRSSVAMLLPGMQLQCPSGWAKQSPGALWVWKCEILIMRSG